MKNKHQLALVSLCLFYFLISISSFFIVPLVLLLYIIYNHSK